MSDDRSFEDFANFVRILSEFDLFLALKISSSEFEQRQLHKTFRLLNELKTFVFASFPAVTLDGSLKTPLFCAMLTVFILGYVVVMHHFSSRRRWTTGSAHSMSCSVLKILCFSIRFKVELPRADLVVHILLKCCMAGTSEKALLCFPLTKFRSCSVQWHDSSGAIGREVVCVETHGSSFDLFFNPECYHLFIS